jgi:hypothetical protein
MTDVQTIQSRAKRRLRELERRRRDPRFARVMGRFTHDGLLTTNTEVVPFTDPLDVADVLWAGEIEPRCLELLPALLVKRPAMFTHYEQLPDDLAVVVRRLRRNLVPASFRGIPGDAVHRWLSRVGRVGRLPSRLESFRLKPEDVQLLEALSKRLGVSKTEVIRRGLRALTGA